MFDGQGSAGLGQYGYPGYDASAEVWASQSGFLQTMGVCSRSSWYVDANVTNSGGAVQSYPSMRRIYHDWSKGGDFSTDPLLSSFPYVKASFAATDPACSSCIYDTAFDVWLNGIGNGAGTTEMMIWTHNSNQYPAGYFDSTTKKVTGISLAGHTWTLYYDGAALIASYVPTDTGNITSGTFDIKAFTDYLVSTGRLPSNSRLGQVSYGVEICSTAGASRHWDFTNMGIDDGGLTPP